MAHQVSTAAGSYDVDVLIVGAGPTGLALAAQLAAYGTSFRILDRRLRPVEESRALAIQPRTLEALRPFGLSAELAAAGTPARRLQLHLPEENLDVDLFDAGLEDTQYGHLLFLPQSETEQALIRHLGSRGVRVERGVELMDLQRLDPEDPFAGMEARIQRMDRGIERIRARYVVGADGVNSTVRAKAGMDFRGGRYPDTFVVADLEVDGVQPDTVHAYPAEDGFLFLFPLGRPAGWRMISIRERGDDSALDTASLQRIVDRFSDGEVTVRDPQWISTFRLSHQIAEYFQNGSVFLAGDAAHVHSPVAAQGMNTGIQDALNLGWKLALGARGLASDDLIDSYDAERRPVAKDILGFTDRIFRLATSRNALMKLPRTKLLPLLAPKATGITPLRSAVYRRISQLGIGYRGSDMTDSNGFPFPGAPRPGDRLPDAEVLQDGARRRLHDVTAAPGFHILLTGQGWEDDAAARLAADLPRLTGLLSVHRLVPGSPIAAAAPGVVQDTSGDALRRLGVRPRRPALLVIRPDGHIGYRSTGTELDGAVAYLRRLTAAADSAAPAAAG